jgi:hypothetical protein
MDQCRLGVTTRRRPVCKSEQTLHDEREQREHRHAFGHQTDQRECESCRHKQPDDCRKSEPPPIGHLDRSVLRVAIPGP